MGNVASLELCKELYELSGWKPDRIGHHINLYVLFAQKEWVMSAYLRGMRQGDIPAYDLGYLLRKLPRDVGIRYLQVFADSGSWLARYGEQKYGDNIQFWGRDEDVTNAVCRLAIELFKQGILTKEAL